MKGQSEMFVFRRLIPSGMGAPDNLPRAVLRKSGYFRLRTWAAAYGKPIPDSDLYLPLFSPWEGQEPFDALYREIHPHTLVKRDSAYVLWKTLQQALHLPGDVLECGVFRGGTALLEAKTMAGQREERALHLFDSFQGMPKTTKGIDRIQEGEFSDTSVETVSALLAPFPFAQIHAGFIPRTFEEIEIPRIAWAYIDVDIYQAVHDCIAYIYPRLVSGGTLLFDDYGFPCCSGARQAVDEAFASLPEVPLCLPTGQCLVTKLGHEAMQW